MVNSNSNDIGSILGGSVNNADLPFVNNPLALPPDGIDPGEGFNNDPNPIHRRWARWAAITGYKKRELNRDESYGPTLILTPNESQAELGASGNYILYPNGALIPCGVYSNFSPTGTIGQVRGFSITPPVFSGMIFDTTNGVIRGTPSTVSSTTFTVAVTGTPGVTYNTSFTLSVFDASCNATISYLNNYLAATGIAFTATPTVWSIPVGVTSITLAPTLPAGLTFTSSNGVISGTATATSPKVHYVVRVKAPDASFCSGNTYSDSFYLRVSGVGFPSAVYPLANSAMAVNVATTLTPTLYSNIGAAAISPALPAGLSFTSATGVISGTPTVVKQSTQYVISFSGTGLGASITDNTTLSLAISGAGSSMSAITLEVIPSDPNLRWNYSDPNFSAIYTVKDYRGTNPSSYALTIGQNSSAKNIFKWILERCRPYQETVLLRAGYYPQFNIGRKSNAWNDAWVSSGIRGVRFIAESTGSAIVQAPQGIKLDSQIQVAGNNVLSAGVFRDLAFSGVYFEGPNYGNTAVFINNLASGTWWPGLHLYNCTLDGMWQTKWLLRLYNMQDFRAIGCTFKDNWMVSSNYSEHGAYISTYAGNNFIINCMFSGLGRNAIQLNSYSSVYSQTFDPPSGAWLISGCSAVECGLSNWYVDAGGNIKPATNGTAFYTIANTSAVWMLDCMASGGFGRPLVSGYSIPGSTGALVVWKNPFFSTSTNTEPWPSFYGNKLFVTSGCNFKIKGGDRSVCEFKNVSTLYITSGNYYSNSKPIFTFSSYGTGNDNANQGPNPNNLPIIASTIFNVNVSSTVTFPNGAPPYILANCPNGHSCQTLNATQISNLVTVNPPNMPSPPAKPTDGQFLYSAGWTNPSDGRLVP